MSKAKDTTIVALSEEHISNITGLTIGQLRRWDARGFFSPRFAYEDRSSAYSRIYSFEDAVGLRTLAKLRSSPYRISIKRLEGLARKMEGDGISHWAAAKVWVVNGEPNYWRPNENEVIGSETGQLSMLPIIDVMSEVETKIEQIKRRSDESVGNVERHKYVARNSWVIAGTRIPTATIVRYVDAGFSVNEILEEYPSLTVSDVRAAINHEKRLVKSV